MITSRILGSLLLAALIAGGAAAQSARTTPSDHGEAITQLEQGTSPLNPISDQPETANFTEWLAVATVVLAVATVALAVFSLCQAVIMSRTARRQLRAYVFVTTAEIGEIDDPQNVHASVSIKNSGQTPAYDLISRGAIDIRESPLKGDLSPRDRDAAMSKSALGPGEVLGKHLGARPLTPDERGAVRSGTQAIYVYGEVLYKDAFGKRRYSRYRFMHAGTAPVRNRQLVVCEKGNEAN
ncbi:MAG: hypothetical protein ACRD1P_03595 [Thermoanaerobaculia bacterium]